MVVIRVTLIVMSSYVHVVVFVWLAIIPATSGYGGGAPESACVDMSPNHGVTAQSGTNPYTLKVEGDDHVSKGGTLKGTIRFMCV